MRLAAGMVNRSRGFSLVLSTAFRAQGDAMDAQNGMPLGWILGVIGGLGSIEIAGTVVAAAWIFYVSVLPLLSGLARP
jgi:hypothetical protein